MNKLYALPLLAGSLVLGGCGLWHGSKDSDKYRTEDFGGHSRIQIEKSALPAVQEALWFKGETLDDVVVSSGTAVDPEKRARDKYTALTVIDKDGDGVITIDEAKEYREKLGKTFHEKLKEKDEKKVPTYLENFTK